MPTIHIVEGPAGAGKSYYIGKRMAELPGSANVSISVSTFFQQAGLRAMPSGADDVMYGMLLDSSRLLMAFHLAIINGHDHVFIDRFVVSQFVYGYLRRRERPHEMTLRPFDPTLVSSEIRGILHEGYNYARYLNPAFLRFSIPDFEIVFILPDEETIESRRALAERAFPFGMGDYALYSSMVNDPAMIARFTDQVGNTTVIRE